MASVRREIRRLVLLLLFVGSLPASSGVFVSRPEASRFLHRARRANTFFEEFKAGNLERECLEEKCSYEEAREIFALPQMLETFWKSYTAVDHCQSSPCKNGATCTRKSGTYACICSPGFHGRHCDKAVRTSHGCLYRNGGCEHFCKARPHQSTLCSCAPGYTLGRDNSSCLPQVSVPCGRLVPQIAPRVVNGYVCPRGQCPWQALLTEDHTYKCGAIVVSPGWILTAAHCVWSKPDKVFHVTVGEHDRTQTEGSEQTKRVSKVLVHPSYNATNSDCDLALLKLHHPIKFNQYVIPVCLPAVDASFSRTMATIRLSTVSGWGRLTESGRSAHILQRLELPRVPLQECRRHTKLNITRNMLCAGVRTGGRDTCQGDSGGPLVTRYKKTWFLTGVVSWGKGCANENMYGVYTRVSKFLTWINQTMSTG